MEAYRKAAELAEISRKDTPEATQLLAVPGGNYAVLGKTDESLDLSRQAKALAPENPNVLFTAGVGF